jgi:hypothetical protein
MSAAVVPNTSSRLPIGNDLGSSVFFILFPRLVLDFGRRNGEWGCLRRRGDQQATNNIHAGMLFTIMTWTHALDIARDSLFLMRKPVSIASVGSLAQDNSVHHSGAGLHQTGTRNADGLDAPERVGWGGEIQFF